MAFFKTRLFTAILAFGLGYFFCYVWGGRRPEMNFSFTRGSTSTERRAPPADPFEEMRRMQEEMMHSFGPGAAPGGGFAQSFGMPTPELHDRGQEYVMEIELNGMHAKNFNVQVERGQLQVDGTLTNGSTMTSHFSQSFPVPPDVDADRLQMDTKGDKLVITLPKK